MPLSKGSKRLDPPLSFSAVEALDRKLVKIVLAPKGLAESGERGKRAGAKVLDEKKQQRGQLAAFVFTRNNGITKGFHTQIEVLQRQAYGLRNFQNYRLPFWVLCS